MKDYGMLIVPYEETKTFEYKDEGLIYQFVPASIFINEFKDRLFNIPQDLQPDRIKEITIMPMNTTPEQRPKTVELLEDIDALLDAISKKLDIVSVNKVVPNDIKEAPLESQLVIGLRNILGKCRNIIESLDL